MGYYVTTYGNSGLWGKGKKKTYGYATEYTPNAKKNNQDDSLYGYANEYIPTKKKKTKIGPDNAAADVNAGYDPYAHATEQADAILASMLADVQRQQDKAHKTAEEEAQLELAKGQALAYGLQQLGISDKIQQIFQTAGQTQAGLASGYSGAVGAEASAQAAAQQQALLGTGQEGAVRNEGAAMGNVIYGTGGAIPATELNTQAANYAANAALQPGFAMQFGAMNSAARRAEWAKELMDWADRKSEVLGKKPSLYQDLLGDERDWSNVLYNRAEKNRATSYAKWKANRDYQRDVYLAELQAQIASDKNVTKAEIEKAKADLKKWDQEHPEPIWRKDSATGEYVGFNPLTGEEVSRAGGKTPPKPPPKPKGDTPAQITAKQVKARNTELARISGVPPEAKTFLGVGDSGQVKVAKRTRAQLVRFLVRTYRARLKRYGVKDSVIVAKVNAIVNAMPADWFKGGQPASGSTSGNPFG